jgi:hypothetical protein
MPSAIGKLRGTSAWAFARRAQRIAGEPTCAVVHRCVRALGPRVAPDDVVLKHIYDHEPIFLDPRTLSRSVRVGEWARVDAARGRRSRLERWRRWWVLGGGWKNVQRHLSRNVHGRFIAGGDWDLRARPFEIRRTIVDMFADGVAASETAEYQQMQRWIASGDFAWTRGCRSVEDLDRYFDELTELHDSMLRDGYLTQTQLGNVAADEIRVCIDRDGRPCVFDGGTHRLSLALLLEVPLVPVVVKRVHASWVASYRDATGDRVEAVERGLDDLRRTGSPLPLVPEVGT